MREYNDLKKKKKKITIDKVSHTPSGFETTTLPSTHYYRRRKCHLRWRSMALGPNDIFFSP